MFNIEKEIEEILDISIFIPTHELKGHCLSEHLLSDKDLQQKLRWMKAKNSDDITLASRFFSQEQALSAIYKLLVRNKEAIRKWRNTLDEPVLEIQGDFTEAGGEGLAKHTDCKTFFTLHGLRIVVIAGDSIGRAFYIKTAYPVNTFEDNDSIYDAMDEYWESQRKPRN